MNNLKSPRSNDNPSQISLTQAASMGTTSPGGDIFIGLESGTDICIGKGVMVAHLYSGHARPGVQTGLTQRAMNLAPSTALSSKLSSESNDKISYTFDFLAQGCKEQVRKGRKKR